MFKSTQYFLAGLFMIWLSSAALFAQYNQWQKLQPGGSAVAISDRFAVVGAKGDSTDATGLSYLDEAGAAYLYAKQGDGSWRLAQKIVAGDRQAGAHFGQSVAIMGDVIAVGAPNQHYRTGTGGSTSNVGTVYLFRLEGSSWVQKQQVWGSLESGAEFGYSVALSPRHLVVGEPKRSGRDRLGATVLFSGAVYLFTLESGGWTLTQNLVRAGAEDQVDGLYGHSVAMQGNTVLVGAAGQNTNLAEAVVPRSGAAYIFMFTGRSWEYGARLDADDPQRFGALGFSVALEGDNALVGAPGQDNAGTVYVFQYDGTTWNRHQKLQAGDRVAGSGSQFGHAVAVSNGYALVGAPGESKDAGGADLVDQAGAAYLFKFGGSTWTPQQKLVANDRVRRHELGTGVALFNQTLLTGSTSFYRGIKPAYLFTIPTYPAYPCSITKVRLFPRTGCSACVGRTIGGLIQVSTVGTAGPWTTIFVIPSETPNAWNEFAIPSSPTGYKAVRYVAPYESYGNLAEVEFYITGGARLTGTPFGDGGGPLHGLTEHSFEKALDGNPATYYDAFTTSGAYVGIETFCRRTNTYRQGADAEVWSAEVMEDRLVVGPNPSPDRFAVQLTLAEAGALQVEVIDGRGQRVWRREQLGQVGENTLMVELGGQAAGLYVLRVSQASGRPPLTAKLLKTGR